MALLFETVKLENGRTAYIFHDKGKGYILECPGLADDDEPSSLLTLADIGNLIAALSSTFDFEF